jgi:imidazolonepropionase-like amidohydrolase
MPALSTLILSLLAADTTLIVPAGIVDPTDGQVRGGLAVLIASDRIAAVAPGRELAPRPGWRVIRLDSAWLLPGFIDLHTHLALGGVGQVAQTTRATLAAGVTTVQDLGALPAAARAGAAPLRVRTAGYWIGRPGGTCDFGGATMPRGPAEFAATTRARIQAGVDVIKVCISSWWPTAITNPDSVEISPAELDSVVRTAHAASRRVVAHAVSEASVRLALAHGVDGLAHLPLVGEPVAREMAARGMAVYPTAASLLAAARGQPWRVRADSAAAALRKAGVPVLFGTDAGALPYGRVDLEAGALARLGWQPAEVLRAATVDAARHLGLEAEVGRVERGLVADLVAVRPPAPGDSAGFFRACFVMRGGVVVSDSAGAASARCRPS